MAQQQYLIIGGVYKAATTSLYTYLNQHNAVCGSSIKETGFFIPARYGIELPPKEKYLNYFKHHQSASFYMDASPGYMYGTQKVINAVDQYLGKENVKVVMVLREPVKRFYSFFKYLKTKYLYEKPSKDAIVTLDMTIEEYLVKSKAHFELGELIKESNQYLISGVGDGAYVNFLPDWEHSFGENLKVVFFEDIKANPELVVQDILAWMGLPQDSSINYSVENKTKDFKNEGLHKLALTVNQKLEPLLRKNQWIKSMLRGVYDKLNQEDAKPIDSPDSTKKALEEYYRPYNQELKDFLLKKEPNRNLPEWLRS